MIDDPKSRRLVNERVRPLCDAAQQTFRGAMHLIAEMDSLAATGVPLDSYIPNTEEVILDGSEEDGRVPLTGADVHRVIEFFRELIVDLNSSQQLPLATINKAAVNGQPRF
jgi:hypothetical protein